MLGMLSHYSATIVPRRLTWLHSMPLEDTLATYQYFVKEADKLDLAYICFLRYLKSFDVELDGTLATSTGVHVSQ